MAGTKLRTRSNRPSMISAVLVASTLVLCGCNLLRKTVRTPPPTYIVFPTPALMARANGSVGSGTKVPPALGERMDDWVKKYDDARSKIYPWAPNEALLKSTLDDACTEYLVSAEDKPALATAGAGFFSSGGDQDPGLIRTDGNASNGVEERLKKKIEEMFVATDREHSNILVTDPDLLVPKPALKTFQLPAMLSYDSPINVSIASAWEGADAVSQNSSASADSAASTTNAVLDKLMVTIQAAPANPAGGAAASKGGAASQGLVDFNPNQDITLSLSTVLNSPSVLDRIEYVSTYIYVYPWQDVPNGSIVLEREFWRKFLAINYSRDPQIRSKLAINDMNWALQDMRVSIRDTATTASLAAIDLGTHQQVTTETAAASIGGTSVISAPPHAASLAPNLSYSQVAGGTASTPEKQQLDQRTTYLDEHGDFLRITQRGMQSANLAGRYKEALKLHIPEAVDKAWVLTAKNDNGKISYAIAQLAEPLYSRVDAFTFSVVVVREAIGLRYSASDHYGLDDDRDATFVVGVTAPQHISLWEWERDLIEVDAWDVYGPSSDSPKTFYFSVDGGRPLPLVLAGFDVSEKSDLYKQIFTAKHGELATAPLDPSHNITIGYADNERAPTKLVPMKAPDRQ